ncbi:GntR family transcriptional regulator [Guptibacillus hwajinpoensis]|uniref:GntR family transcriptional regulator n=1 Tax=Guptibacillus hwajinpoensis TaxID=208199 RepID=UPI001CD693A3|nr:GntR family transcriptional regulator [Pseudalkalibacillus hwajinpoensis]MCA0993827.1 GntR family transcriptional regulator [Pseudalkalibacillus hwajinpoensis]
MIERSSEKITKQLIRSILEKEWRTNDPLPPERELATHYQVGRPTIREALQRLERDGWVTIRKGAPALVNDYWKRGNLMTIVNILQHHDDIPDEFIVYMLELRITLTPAYVRDALLHHRLQMISLFIPLQELPDDPKSYAEFDWKLQKNVAELSPNPVFLLILNSFENIYGKMAEKYFLEPSHRKASKKYYDQFLEATLKGDLHRAETLTKQMMVTSLELWKIKMNGGV